MITGAELDHYSLHAGQVGASVGGTMVDECSQRERGGADGTQDHYVFTGILARSQDLLAGNDILVNQCHSFTLTGAPVCAPGASSV